MENEILPITKTRVAFLFLFGVIAIALYNHATNTVTTLSRATPVATEISSGIQTISDVEARGAAIVSENGTLLASKNADTQYPLASLTKLITVYTALRELPPSKLITIPADAVPDTSLSLIAPGEHWTVGQLATIALVASSNEAATSLCAAMGESCITKLRETARGLGLTSTYFSNPSGLDLHLGVIGGAYGTARDVAKLFLAAMKDFPAEFGITKESSVTLESATGRRITIENTNKDLAMYPTILGSKTGTTRVSGGNLTIITRHAGDMYALVILGSGEETRFTDIKKLDEIATTLSTRNQTTQGIY